MNPKTFLPTQPAKPRRGELLTKDEILMDYINRHDTGLEGFVRPVYTPSTKMQSLPKNNPIVRNLYLGAIKEFHAVIA